MWNWLVKIWNMLFKKKKSFHKLVLEIDESIHYGMALEIITGLSSDIIINRLGLCKYCKTIDHHRSEFIAEAHKLDFFQYKYYLNMQLNRLIDSHLKDYVRISFRIKIFYNTEEKDLDKYEHVLNVVLERAYHTDDWHIEKCALAW